MIELVITLNGEIEMAYDTDKEKCDKCGKPDKGNLILSFKGGAECKECHKESELSKLMKIKLLES
jgi:hypothetical protein